MVEKKKQDMPNFVILVYGELFALNRGFYMIVYEASDLHLFNS